MTFWKQGMYRAFEMEDDFTSIDILKYDTRNGDVIYGDSEAYLTLYRPILDEKGFRCWNMEFPGTMRQEGYSPSGLLPIRTAGCGSNWPRGPGRRRKSSNYEV